MAKKKLFYKIGEACKLLDIQPYVLRYWETEFPFLDPDKSQSGQRVYGEPDLEIIRRIKALLYDEGYTIAGAKKKLESELGEDEEGKPVLLAPEEAESAASDDGVSRRDLDRAEEKIKMLRGGIEGALAQARDILSRLDALSP